jgi:hypothetical protein
MPDDVTILPRVAHAALIAFIASAYRAAGIASATRSRPPS